MRLLPCKLFPESSSAVCLVHGHPSRVLGYLWRLVEKLSCCMNARAACVLQLKVYSAYTISSSHSVPCVSIMWAKLVSGAVRRMCFQHSTPEVYASQLGTRRVLRRILLTCDGHIR